ncbi:hypothetical protein VTO42DRAFT_5055 [Malbranchea cinnamomea]
MITTEEGWHILPDGMKLYTKTWKPDIPTRAILAFVHGFSDHCNAYYEFFPTLASYGIEVRAFDQRGWGRSVTTPASRGLTGPTTVVISDIHSFLMSIKDSIERESTAQPAQASESRTTPPIFLLGHSMGGGEVLYYMLNSPLFPPWIRGVLAYSPLIALHPKTQPSPLIVATGRLAAKIRPHRQMRQLLDPYLMCRDKRVCEDWKNDPLCHNLGTLEGLAGLLDRSAWLRKLKSGDRASPKEDTALWVCHGTADQINDFEASKRFSQVVGVRDKTFKAYEGGFHKLHGEPDGIKEALAKDIAEWILDRCDSGLQDDMGSKSKL